MEGYGVLRICRVLLAIAAMLYSLNIGQSTVNGQLIDCIPDYLVTATDEICASRGCTWNKDVPAGVPWCTFPNDYGYSLVDGPNPTTLGNEFHLQRKDFPSLFGNDIDNVYVSVEYWSPTVLRLKYYDPANIRYEVPLPITAPSSPPADTDYAVEFTNSPSFGISISRKSTGEIIFNTGLPGFVFSDQFLQISTNLPSSNLYGFGENRHQTFAHDLNWKTWTMFTRDNAPEDDFNLYGVQPFYLNLENNGNANGVFLLNSNALEIKVQPSPALTYRSIGGILDFYIFLGPTPEDVVQQFTSLVGYPYLPPYWSLGFQLSRWGVPTAADLQNIIDGMRNANLPHDVQYSDIDYMDSYLDFTRDPVNYADLPNVVQDLHDHGQKYVVILDCAIGNQDYYGRNLGLQEDIFIKYPNGTILEGNVWPGNAYYPDYSMNSCQEYWNEMARYLYEDENVKYDGLWIDMNEPSNFVVGSTSGCGAPNQWNYPPYVPNILDSTDGSIMTKTICMEAVQEAGRHYDVHSLTGYYMGLRTFKALRANFPENRPMVVSRSQYSGSSKYTTHWLGDNDSSWSNLRDSIIGILEYNLFGTPFVGADICGFGGDTSNELCIRWSQLGSLYPFSRNHNSEASRAQDPPTLGPDVVDANMKAYTERYRLLPYLYTLLHYAHVKGSTVVRSLMHEFPQDSYTWAINFQFLWGSGLLVSPVVEENATTVDAYFPSAKWYDYYTGAEVTNVGAVNTLSAPLDGYIPLHVRGGVIIPTQEPSVTTTLSRQNPMGVIVPLDSIGKASGTLFWDDGETFETEQAGLYNEFQYTVADNTLDIAVVNSGFGAMTTPLNNVLIYGLQSAPTGVTVDGAALEPAKFSYDDVNKVLTLSELNLTLPGSHEIIF